MLTVMPDADLPVIVTVYAAVTAPSEIGGGPLIAIVGVASSSVIVPAPVGSAIVAFSDWPERVTMSCRSGSSRSFPCVAMSKFALVWPAGIVTVSFRAV